MRKGANVGDLNEQGRAVVQGKYAGSIIKRIGVKNA